MGSISYSIRIDEKLQEGGFWSLTSDNLPGLFLAGQDLPALRNELPDVIKKLFELNYSMDVEVRLLLDNPPARPNPNASARTWAAIPKAA
jgi:hypothetical protein